MTRSIFDPSNPDVENSGSRNVVGSAAQNSSMPADVVDGKVEPDEAQAAGQPMDTKSIAERLDASVPPVEPVKSPGVAPPKRAIDRDW